MTIAEGAEIEVKKCRPKKGEVFTIVIKSDDIDEHAITLVREKVRKQLPDNKVFVFGIGIKDDIFVHATKDQKDMIIDKLAEVLSAQYDKK